MSEMGTARLAMTVARRLCRKKKITSTTMSTASTSSSSTWWTEPRMPVVRSDSTCTLSDAGRPACSSGNSFLMLSTVAITLAPGWRCTLRMIAGVMEAPTLPTSCGSLPPEGAPACWGRPGAARRGSLTPAHAPSRLFSALSTTRATSSMRTGAPLRHDTMRFL